MLSTNDLAWFFIVILGAVLLELGDQLTTIMAMLHT